jgi:hypothetical protein
MMPLFAIFAVVLLGSMALATDLSVNTHYKRLLQNTADSAALAGAKLLPVSPVLSDQQNATAAALSVIHNSYPWSVTGSNWAVHLAASGCAGSQCSVTVCAGLTGSAPCTSTVSAGSKPLVVTVNTPPLTAMVAQYDGDVHRVEVVVRQQSAVSFAAIIGQSAEQEAAQSVAYHFAPGQPMPFALFSRTYIQSGNDGETVAGNIYADRLLAPQSNGHAGICAAPDPNGNPGFIFLGYPQQNDGSPPYQSDGQSTSHGDPILGGATCPASGGTVAMSANPNSSSACAAGYPGNNTGTTIRFDAPDNACEANPAFQAPMVAALPNVPTYPSTVCGAAGLAGGVYQPNEYACASGAALTVNHTLAPGIYEIDAGSATGGCDVTMDGSITTLAGVTFYLKGGAGICISLPSGATVTQTPYNAGTGDPGDGRYIAVSDNVASPSITLTSSGGGSTSGIWRVTGVIWLPTGTITINNKTALEDSGQVVVNVWNDQSGYHQNPSVSYNGTFAVSQVEVLQLSE